MADKERKRKEYMKHYRETKKQKLIENRREYYKDNQEEINERRRQIYLRNKEELNKRRRKFYLENQEKINTKRRNHYLQNREQINEERRKTYTKNRGILNESRRKIYLKNREIINLKRRESYSQKSESRGNKATFQRLENDHNFKSAVLGSQNFIKPSTFLLGALNNECQFCEAVYFKGEKIRNCCHNGKVALSFQEDFPIELKNLFTDNDSRSKNFREYIRQYNNANAFAYMETKHESVYGNGPYCFKVLGEVNYKTSKNIKINYGLNSSVLQQSKDLPSYSELYLYDDHVSLEIRLKKSINENCLLENMKIIASVLNSVSPYAKNYRKLREIFEKEKENSQMTGQKPKHVSLIFLRVPNNDEVEDDCPIYSNNLVITNVSEIDNYTSIHRDFTVYLTGCKCLTNINHLSQHLDPMIFPIFFPRGEHGWTTKLSHELQYATAVRQKVTVLQFYSFKIAIRRNYFNPLFYGGKLFQQYLVYAYTRHEANQMCYIRNNQKDFRVDLYKGLFDYSNDLELKSSEFIRIFILPSSFVGGPRFISKLYQDNIAMVRKFGLPDLFITFTCNPRWPEILSELQQYQTSSDRPDVVTRVFYLKFKELLHDITKKQIFGKVSAFFYKVEFQKRGLPHAHCLFTFLDEDKIKTSDQVDNIISAELPDRKVDPQLFNIILSHNIHGPCSSLDINSPCHTDSHCSKNFPKRFVEQTDAFSEDFPRYRRRDNSGELLETRNHISIDNSWVVPYNPYLSVKYGTHINVELCSTVQAVKYIHKFITQNSDYTQINVKNELPKPSKSAVIHDEISQYLNRRYISSLEAAWRLQTYPIHGQSYNVVLLAVHLQDGQSIYFQEKENETQLRCKSVESTTLTAYFDLNNSDDVIGHQHYYHNIPNYYVFKDNRWEKRSESSHFGMNTIGRMVSVSPKNVELYHFRLLLLNVKGKEATSFQKLKEYNGISYQTYKQAAAARGLISDTSEWNYCMLEASRYLMPRALRSLFVSIVTVSQPTNSLQLFEEYENYMIQDFIDQMCSSTEALKLCYREIKEQFEKEGIYSDDILPLLIVDDKTVPENSRNKSQSVISPDKRNFNNLLWSKLNSDQRLVAESIYKSVTGGASEPRCFYIDGPAGSGKTFTYKSLIEKLQNSGYITLSVAWTGIAANLLPNGTTVHSAFSLPLQITSECFPVLSQSKKTSLKNTNLFIWDEAPMAPGLALELVDKIFRDIMNNDIPFGGKVVVLGGDFRQVLPVLKNGTKEDIIQSTIKNSFLWTHFQKFHLKINMRTAEDHEFSAWLLEIGNGNPILHSVEKLSRYSIPIPDKFLSNDIVPDIFDECLTSNNFLQMSRRAILCPKNKDVHEINEEILRKIEGEEKMFLAMDSVRSDEDRSNEYTDRSLSAEFLKTLNPRGLPPYCLTLKKGCIVILLRTISISKGLCNGTRMIVRNFGQNVLFCEIITGTFSGNLHFIPRISIDTSGESILPFVMIRHQFPVQLAYAMTINKAQGQTFDKIGLYLPEPCFTHGQLYTACSRTTRSTSLRIQIHATSCQGKTETDKPVVTDNIVFPEIFSESQLLIF